MSSDETPDSVRGLFLKSENLHLGVLQGVDFELQPGELVALVGANGAGKSTLVRALSGLASPSSGKVVVDGVSSEDPAFLRMCRQHTGLVFQNPESQFVANTVEDEVAFGPGQLGLPVPELRERVDWALEVVGLSERRDWQSHALSAGQKQRLAIAATLALKPRYLLLDEPTSMLDPKAREELLDLLLSLCGELGILLITHRSPDVARCQRAVLLRDGKASSHASTEFPELGLDLPDFTRLERLAPDPPARPFLPHRSETPAVARAEKISFCYNPGTRVAHTALQEASCEFPARQCTGIVGQTGSGKSTLLQHLNLLLRPQSGRLWLFGEPVGPRRAAAPVRQRVGLLFQQPENGFFEETVWDEISYGPRNFGLEYETNGRLALQTVGLPFETFAARNPFELSGGEQRRLALACVLACQPEMLILDEPTAGLDARYRHQFWALLQRLCTEGKSLVIISHDLEEIGELAQHLIWLDGGRVRREGLPSEIYPELQGAGFPLPAWCRWSLQHFPEAPVPVSWAQLEGWLSTSPN